MTAGFTPRPAWRAGKPHPPPVLHPASSLGCCWVLRDLPGGSRTSMRRERSCRSLPTSHPGPPLHPVYGWTHSWLQPKREASCENSWAHGPAPSWCTYSRELGSGSTWLGAETPFPPLLTRCYSQRLQFSPECPQESSGLCQ